MANMNQEQMVEELSKWSVMEVAGLVKALEAKWGVSAAPAAVAVAAGPAAAGAAPAPEQTEFTVTLTESGAKKIDVIKVVREVMSGVGLAEAKAVVEATPKVIKESATKAEAEEIKKKFEAAGAKVEIK
jgi:large subunit ribosomal protein L7/L12